MKKLTAIILSLTMLFGLAACSNGGSPEPSSEADTNMEASSETPEPASSSETEEIPSVPENETSTLVVYFSMPETTDPDNMTEEEANSTVIINDEVLGNTQYVAYVIQENTGADIFRIEPKTPYPTDHETLVDLAAEEQDQNARPELLKQIENLEQYSTIFIGYPNWWGDMPMILYSFFDEHDFSGKTIIPFNTHGGSGFSDTINSIAELEPEAAVNQDGFTVSRNNVQEAEPDIVSWLNELGYTKLPTVSDTQTQLSIQVGDLTLSAELYDTQLAKDFAALLPQTISMQRVGGGREFYGSIDGNLNYDEADSQTTFENGEIAYWYSGNGLCLLYDNQVEKPEVDSGIIIIGKITSDFSELHNLEDNITATISITTGGE